MNEFDAMTLLANANPVRRGRPNAARPSRPLRPSRRGPPLGLAIAVAAVVAAAPAASSRSAALTVRANGAAAFLSRGSAQAKDLTRTGSATMAATRTDRRSSATATDRRDGPATWTARPARATRPRTASWRGGLCAPMPDRLSWVRSRPGRTPSRSIRPAIGEGSQDCGELPRGCSGCESGWDFPAHGFNIEVDYEPAPVERLRIRTSSYRRAVISTREQHDGRATGSAATGRRRF